MQARPQALAGRPRGAASSPSSLGASMVMPTASSGRSAPSLSSPLSLSSLPLPNRARAVGGGRAARPAVRAAAAAAPGAASGGPSRAQRPPQAAATEILAAAAPAPRAAAASSAPPPPPAASASADSGADSSSSGSDSEQAQQGAVFSRALPGVAAPQFEPGGCTVFSEEFRIRGNEAGPDQRVDVVTVANLLQEVGGNHGVALWGRADSGFAAMPGMDHLLFVATRMQIRMHHYPKWGDLVRLETWFQEDGRLATRRDWRLTDVASGAELGAATSTWVTINDATRRLSRLPENVRTRFLPLSPSPPRHALPAGDTRRKLPDLPPAPPAADAGSNGASSPAPPPAPLSASAAALAALPPGPLQIARRSEMDPNGHINNVTYLEWALESAPAELVSVQGAAEGWRLAEVEIDFKAECTAGDRVEACVLELPSPTVAEAPVAAAAAARRARAAAAACSMGRREAAKAGRAAAPGRKRALLKQLLLELAGRGGEAAAVAAAAQQEERRAAAAALVASVDADDPAGVAAAAAAAAEEAQAVAAAAASSSSSSAASSSSSPSSSADGGDADAPPLPTRQFLHVLRKHERGPDGKDALNEVWRARLTWVCDGPVA